MRAEGKNAAAIERRVDEFEGRPIPAVFVRGEWYWPARVVGRVIEQGDGGKRFVRNVTSNDEFEEGVEFVRVAGDELAAVRAALALPDSSTVPSGADSAPRETSEESGGTESMVLLSESGVFLALQHSRKPIGRRMRRWLAREVLPSIRRTGSYVAPAANDTGPAFVNLVAKMSECLVEIRREQVAQRDRSDRLAETVAALAARVSEQGGGHGLLGKRGARELLDAVGDIAAIYAPRRSAEWTSRRTSIELAVKTAAGVGQQRTELLPRSCEAAAWREIYRQERAAEEFAAKRKAAEQARAAAEAALKQRTLFDALPANIRAFQS